MRKRSGRIKISARFFKITLLLSGFMLIAIQFISPARNTSGIISDTDISKALHVPDTVMVKLKAACYDCHSNNTNYPWYAGIQPVGWLLSNHIKSAKAQLNFSGFGNYSVRRQTSKLDGIANSIKDNIMPLKSYKLMHKEARLTDEEKNTLIQWSEQTRDSISGQK